MNKIAAVIQARSNSTRFPGKCLTPINGIPMIEHITNTCLGVMDVVIAVPKGDKPLIDWAVSKGLKVYEGSETNLLERYYGAAQHYGLTHIMRLTGDCPCVQVQDLALMYLLSQASDFASNCADYCVDGFEVEVMSYRALEWAYSMTNDKYDREHVTPYIKRDLDRFRQAGFRCIKFAPKYNPEWFPKLSVDTPEELVRVEAEMKKIGGYVKDAQSNQDRWKGSFQKLLQLA